MLVKYYRNQVGSICPRCYFDYCYQMSNSSRNDQAKVLKVWHRIVSSHLYALSKWCLAKLLSMCEFSKNLASGVKDRCQKTKCMIAPNAHVICFSMSMLILSKQKSIFNEVRYWDKTHGPFLEYQWIMAKCSSKFQYLLQISIFGLRIIVHHCTSLYMRNCKMYIYII